MKEVDAILTTTLVVFDNIVLMAKEGLRFSALDHNTADPIIMEEYENRRPKQPVLLCGHG